MEKQSGQRERRPVETGNYKSNRRSRTHRKVSLRNRARSQGLYPGFFFKQKYGYYEARYKLPARIDKDYWASFWLMAGPVGSGETDTTKAMEIDIMESFTFDRTLHTANFHWGGYGATHNKYSLDCGTWPKQQVLNPAGEFHVFGFYWDKDLYVFYLDGVEIGRTNMVGLGSTANGLIPSNGTAQVEGYMLLSCEAAMWPGDNSQGWDADAPEQDEFLIDYVRVYDQKTAFEVWSAGSTSTFGGDANGDGVPDGAAWMLGSPSPGQSANHRLPAAGRANDGGLTLSFNCLNAASRGLATLSLQFSRDLGVADSWEDHTVAVPSSSGTDSTSGVTFVITPNGNLNQVQATIPASAAGVGGRIFCRLRALPTP